MTPTITLIPPATDSVLRQACQQLREHVFIVEQKIDPRIERDDRDSDSWHLLMHDKTMALATGRLLPEGRIGRMAVDSRWRGQGLGRCILEGLLLIAASQGLPRVGLHAQAGAVDFYRRAGFVTCGKDFVEAGILHTPMDRACPAAPEDLQRALDELQRATFSST
ncbi:MAG: GNAT family N-acetyltransferase [Oceanococcaceae bacterium]